MLIVLPRSWKRPEPSGARLLERPPDGCALEEVRSALATGERLFLLCAEGVGREPGWLMATDHVSLFGGSPLAGPNRDDLGPRFPSLMGLYAAPEGPWGKGIVARVPDWMLGTPAELELLRADALVSEGVQEAEVAGHGSGRALLLVRVHGFDEPNRQDPLESGTLTAALSAAEGLRESGGMITGGGEGQ